MMPVRFRLLRLWSTQITLCHPTRNSTRRHLQKCSLLLSQMLNPQHNQRYFQSFFQSFFLKPCRSLKWMLRVRLELRHGHAV